MAGSSSSGRGRTDNVWGLDLMLKYDFRIVEMDCNLRLDAFNAPNNQNVVRVEVVAEKRRTGIPRENYGEPQYYQSPRTVRLGIGLSF